MPGGRCAAAGDPARVAAARMAALTISVAGTDHKLFLSGLADASFPERSPAQLANLPAGDSFSVQWADAIFTGRHGFLGEVTANLVPDGSATGPSFVRSLQGQAATAQQPPAGFFPAVNRNFLRFRIHIPRLGLVMGSDEPVVNESEIHQIPPYRSLYKLVRPVEFKATRGLSQAVAAAVAPPVTVRACDVKLVVGEGLEAKVSLLDDDGHSVRFQVEVTKTTEEPVQAYSWTVWPRPEIESTHWHGARALKGVDDSFEVTLKRDIFFRERWLHAVASEPFATEATGAGVFPALP